MFVVISCTLITLVFVIVSLVQCSVSICAGYFCLLSVTFNYKDVMRIWKVATVLITLGVHCV